MCTRPEENPEDSLARTIHYEANLTLHFHQSQTSAENRNFDHSILQPDSLPIKTYAYKTSNPNSNSIF
jgi:hypothetical protein